MKPKDGDRPPLSRRDFIKNLAVSGALLQTEPRPKPPSTGSAVRTNGGLIDRRQLVSRHSPVIRQLDPVSPLSVGNGEFAFTADVTGHNWQRSDLPCYLPGNGGLLYAAAMMAGGWRSAPRGRAPGFPSDGSWVVRSERFDKAFLESL